MYCIILSAYVSLPVEREIFAFFTVWPNLQKFICTIVNITTQTRNAYQHENHESNNVKCLFDCEIINFSRYSVCAIIAYILILYIWYLRTYVSLSMTVIRTYVCHFPPFDLQYSTIGWGILHKWNMYDILYNWNVTYCTTVMLHSIQLYNNLAFCTTIMWHSVQP